MTGTIEISMSSFLEDIDRFWKLRKNSLDRSQSFSSACFLILMIFGVEVFWMSKDRLFEIKNLSQDNHFMIESTTDGSWLMPHCQKRALSAGLATGPSLVYQSWAMSHEPWIIDQLIDDLHANRHIFMQTTKMYRVYSSFADIVSMWGVFFVPHQPAK